MVEIKEEQKPATAGSGTPGRSFLRFVGYQVDPSFRRLDANIRLQAKEEVLSVFDLFRDRMVLFTYNLMATRAEADFLICQIADDIEVFENFASRMTRSAMGPYLKLTRSYLGLLAPSAGIKAPVKPEAPPRPSGEQRFLFVHAVKSSSGQPASAAEIKKLIGEFFAAAVKYNHVHLSVVESAGFDDQELLLIFEADNLVDFLELQEEMCRLKILASWSQSLSMTGIGRDLKWILDALG